MSTRGKSGASRPLKIDPERAQRVEGPLDQLPPAFPPPRGESRPLKIDPERAQRVEGPLDQLLPIPAPHHVYIVTNKTHTVLYIGLTGFLAGRIYQHREKLIDGFTRRYQVSKLIYFESFPDRLSAEKREEQLKGWRRSKKVALIEKMNPHWLDLFRPMQLDPNFNPLLNCDGLSPSCSRDPSTPRAAAHSAQDLGGNKMTMPPSGAGRPSKIDPERAQRVEGPLDQPLPSTTKYFREN